MENIIMVSANEGGIMEFTEEEILAIKEELELIIEAFEPDAYTVTPTIQYVVSEYNADHVGEEINGDTAQYILGYVSQSQDPIVEETPVS